MRRQVLLSWCVPIIWLCVTGCGDSEYLGAEDAAMSGKRSDSDFGGGAGACGGVECAPGFHCEFDSCLADTPPPPPPSAEVRDPLSSRRYVFALEIDARRLVRIDSLTLEVAAFPAGLAPMDLAVIGSRELSVLLDALDVIEVLDHRQNPPVPAAWTTARSLSHMAPSPSGQHMIAYFDWDDTRAQDRQTEPGNINQISVLALEDGADVFADDDERLVNIAVGFLPRDVRFSSDGTRAVIISRDTLTPIELLDVASGVATPNALVSFDGSAAEILIDAEATRAVMRFTASTRIDVVDLASGATACIETPAAISDISMARDGRLVAVFGDGTAQSLALIDLGVAGPAPCATVTADISVGDAQRISLDPVSDHAIAYRPEIAVETIWHVDLVAETAASVRLEKAISAVAFAGDGRYATLAHMKMAGTPAWDPTIEDPEVSVDKSFGVSWIDLETDAHRLAVSNVPFGPFTFVPADGGEGATYQAVLDERQPQVLRVSHRPGFDDRWLDLAALPLQMGFLPETRRTYVTQAHPWGRVTFIDPTGDELRHVTGFALEVQ